MAPIEIIREWQRGCSCADDMKPWQCDECTTAMIGALKKEMSEAKNLDVLKFLRGSQYAFRYELPEDVLEIISREFQTQVS